MQVRYTITFICLIVLAFISPPFIFSQTDFITREVRSFFVIIALLLIFLNATNYRVSDLFFIVLASVLLLVEAVFAKSELNNIVSYYAVIFLVIYLYKLLRARADAREVFLRVWIKVAYILSFLGIATFLVHQFTSFDTDFLNFSSNIHLDQKSFEFSIFGLSQAKNFGFISLARIDGYFFEPSYAGVYFGLNVLLSKNLENQRRYRLFKLISIVAGILTFSATFYLVLVVILVFYVKSQGAKLVFVFPLFIVLFFLVIYIFEGDSTFSNELLKKTSFDDRFERFSNSFAILQNSSTMDLLFGHGVGYTNNFDRGISSGLLHVLVERGVFGLLLVLSMVLVYSNRNLTLILAGVFFLLVVSWYKSYIYWFGYIIAGLIYMDLMNKNNASNTLRK